MTLTLRAVSLNEQPLSQPITACFDAKGGTIGRADHNTMALPDPERHISRLQAEISVSGPRYLIKNVGAANPIVVAGRPLAQGETVPLAHRDQVRIGGYLLEVSDDNAFDIAASNITRGRAAIDAMSQQPSRASEPRTPLPVRPMPATRAAPPGATLAGLGDVGAPLSSSNPFADLLGPAAPLDALPGASPLDGFAPAPAHTPAPAMPAPRAAPPASKPAPIDPFADLMPPPAGVAAGSGAFASPPAPAMRLPDDFDPFAPPPAAPAAPPAPSVSTGPAGGAFDDLIPNAAPSSIDAMFDLPARNDADPLAAFMATPTPNAKPGTAGIDAASGLSTDPLALFASGDAPPPATAPAPSLPDRTPQLNAAFTPPRIVPQPAPAAPAPATAMPRPSGGVPLTAMLPTGWGEDKVAKPAADATNIVKVAPSPPATVPTPAPAMPLAREPASAYHAPPAAGVMPAAAPAASVAQAAPASGDVAALWAAFCEGAGVRLDLPQGLSPEMMRVVGTLLRTAVDGTLQMMQVRAATKSEFRAAVTVIQARNNNPLKFSPNAENALEQMLQPPMRGFLSGPAAMTDAMNDLVGHAIGTMAGMRAALDGMLGRFTPAELEAKLVGSSMLDSLLPMNRKAKLWDLYLQHFESIRSEAQEDFHALFGKAFLAAYEQQLERLQSRNGKA